MIDTLALFKELIAKPTNKQPGEKPHENEMNNHAQQIFLIWKAINLQHG